jgi:transketolase
MRYVNPTPVETKTSMRQAYGKALIEVAKVNRNVVIIDSDIISPARAWFQKEAPDRLFEVGLTEGNAISVASGLASEWKIPFVFNMGFLLSLMYSQIRQSVAEDKRNVKIVCYGCGVSGIAGASHNYVEDLAVMRSIPNFMVLAPADIVELTKMVGLITEYEGPVYMRFPREPPIPIVFEEDYPVTLGKAFKVKDGKDATIIATGSMVAESLIAANKLQNKMDVGVLNVNCLKPLDRQAIIDAAQPGLVFTAEEHSIIGGLGEAVAAVLAEENPVPVMRIGVNDRFCPSGQWDCKKYYGLNSDDVVNTVKQWVSHW